MTPSKSKTNKIPQQYLSQTPQHKIDSAEV